MGHNMGMNIKRCVCEIERERRWEEMGGEKRERCES